MANLAESLARTAASHPDRIAVKLDGQELTYEQLDDASARLAGLLADRGVRPGDRVGVMLANVPQFLVVYYGILRLGAIVVPMNVLLKEREAAYYLADSGARAVFAWHELEQAARPAAEQAAADCLLVAPGAFERLLAGAQPVAAIAQRADSDTAVILYTSGTTGTPKGAELTHANLIRNVEVILGLFSLTSEDVIFGGLPLFHSFGQTCAMNAAVAAGASLTMLARFDPDAALDIVARDRVTVFEGVPTMYVAILNCSTAATADASSLRLCACGGSSLPVEVLHAFERRFQCSMLEGYGMSETSPVASFNHPDRPARPGSIGTPVEGVQMRLLDERGHEVPRGEVGEIAVRGHNVMKGYWNRPRETTEAIVDGWMHTGDLARVDEDGYFYIVDRKKDMIIRGGYNVYPREIEEVLYEHPAVREAAVLGLPDEQLGEEVGAAVVPREGSAITAAQLQEFVKERLAAYKYPRHIWFVEDLPKSPTGKILKREIAPPRDLRERT